MRKVVLFFIFTLSCLHTFSQSYKQYNHYIANQGLLNPAYSGTRGVLSALLLSRNQWVGLDGAPVTQAFNVHSSIPKTNLGLGLSFSNENIGATNSLDFYGSVSYMLPVSQAYTLSLGVQLGINSFSFDENEIVVTDASDQVLANSSNTAMNAGFGSYLYSDKAFAALSIPEFFTNEYDLTTSTYTKTFDYKSIHYFLYGGYVFENGDFSVKPTVLSRFVYGAPVQFDLTANVLLYNKAWLGLSYKTTSEIVFLLEYLIDNRLSVRYSYDYPFNALSATNYGSHEIGLQYDISLTRTVMKSIRYF